MITNEFFKQYLLVIKKREEKIQKEMKKILSERVNTGDEKILNSLIAKSRKQLSRLNLLIEMIK